MVTSDQGVKVTYIYILVRHPQKLKTLRCPLSEEDIYKFLLTRRSIFLFNPFIQRQTQYILYMVFLKVGMQY